MKTHQRIYILAAVILGVLLCVSCGKKLTGIKIDPSEYGFEEGPTFRVGISIKFWVEFIPEKAENCSVTWYSSNPAVAVVDNTGMMTTVGYGRATIICKTNNKKEFTDSVRIRVTEDYGGKLLGSYRGTIIVDETTIIADTVVFMYMATKPANYVFLDFPVPCLFNRKVDITFENGMYRLYKEEAGDPWYRIEGTVDTQGNANLECDAATDPPTHITFTGKRE